MFVIRKAQMAALSKSIAQDFENRMVNHLGEVFPNDWEAFDEGKRREMIQYGIARSESYDLTMEYEVCLYLYLMLMLGRDFDKDPALPWVRTILDDPRHVAQRRIEQIYDLAVSDESSDQEGGD